MLHPREKYTKNNQGKQMRCQRNGYENATEPAMQENKKQKTTPKGILKLDRIRMSQEDQQNARGALWKSLPGPP